MENNALTRTLGSKSMNKMARLNIKAMGLLIDSYIVSAFMHAHNDNEQHFNQSRIMIG